MPKKTQRRQEAFQPSSFNRSLSKFVKYIFAEFTNKHTMKVLLVSVILFQTFLTRKQI